MLSPDLSLIAQRHFNRDIGNMAVTHTSSSEFHVWTVVTMYTIDKKGLVGMNIQIKLMVL